MIYDDLIRQSMLGATGLIFLAVSAWAALNPYSLAKLLGYELTVPNGQSEFHAIYGGVFLAQAVLCGMAAVRVGDAALGDLVALFLLAQPLGRLLALVRFGPPTGAMRWLFALELIGGLTLISVRPSV